MAKLSAVGIDFLDDAEHLFTIDVDLPASIEEVWAVIIDNSSWTEWFEGCRSMVASTPTWKSAGDTRTITVGRMHIEELAVVLDEPNRWAMSVTRSTVPMASRMLEVLDLTDTSRQGEVRTEVRWTGALDLPIYLRPLRGLLEMRLSAIWAVSLESLLDAVIARR